MDGHSCDVETIYVLYGLVRYLRPALIVEAGTYMGHAAAAMAMAMKEGQIDGEVWTADIADYGAQKVMEDNGLSALVHCFLGDFGAMLDGPLAGRKPRVAFIDSGFVMNSNVGVPVDLRVTHFRNAIKMLGPDGIVVVDDMASDEFVGAEEIRKKAGIVLPNGRGLALVQR